MGQIRTISVGNQMDSSVIGNNYMSSRHSNCMSNVSAILDIIVNAIILKLYEHSCDHLLIV